VLIVRVHPELLESEGLPDVSPDDHSVWHDRFRSMTNLERHLHANGTRIVKIFLNLSKEEQRERGFRKDYMQAYEECLSATSTDESSWYVVPADDKQNARLIVSQILVDTLHGLKMHYPEASSTRTDELLAIRKHLQK
jgi:polyphosphate kinase 2 (PPK2 family)